MESLFLAALIVALVLFVGVSLTRPPSHILEHLSQPKAQDLQTARHKEVKRKKELKKTRKERRNRAVLRMYRPDGRFRSTNALRQRRFTMKALQAT